MEKHSMTKKRIVITGMGVVSCFGNDVDTFYKHLLAGDSGVAPISKFPCEDYTTRFAAEIPEFDPEPYLDKKQARRVDSFITYGMVAGKKALEHAGLTGDALEKLDKNKCGVLIGSGMGGLGVFFENAETLLTKGCKRVSPFMVPFIITNMAGALIAMDTGFMGPNYSISTACATSNNSIIAAANHIRKGDADLMLCGGTEAAIISLGLAGFCQCKALSQRNDDPKKASRPWDTNRDGFVMGEGAGVLVLESLEHALARGATIYAEYLGGGISCDAYHMTEPRDDGEGVALCIREALKDADVRPEQVNYINAHATSTPAGDMVEVKALKQVFKNPEKIKMNSTKSMIGHGLGAAGGFEAVVTVMAMQTGMIHPTINLDNPEPDLAFDVPTKAEKHEIKVALSNSFGFGGHNASIVLSPYKRS
jgi:3-oxoacyl-[acyl-carrier-protein] synthase II